MLIHQPSDDFIVEDHFIKVPLHQGTIYRRWQNNYKRKVVSVVIEDNKKAYTYIQCIGVTVPRIGTLWTATNGPLGSFSDIDICEQFYKTLTNLCCREATDTIAIRIQYTPLSRYVRTTPAEKSNSVYLQPYHEYIVDISGSMNEVISRFSKNTQRIIKNEQVICNVYKSNFLEHFSIFYNLIRATATKKNFTLHPKEYYKSLFETLEKNKELGFLVVAFDEHKNPLATSLIICTGDQAYYLFGGSDEAGAYLNASVSVQVASMREAKARKKSAYNLGAVASPSTPHLKKLSIFKKKFGGETVIQESPKDIVVSKKRYYIFRLTRLSVVKYAIYLLRKCIKTASNYTPKIIRFIAD